MRGRPVIDAYDRYMIECFQMQMNPNEVYRKLNYQELLKGEKPVVSRWTVYNRYKTWKANGKPGELYAETHRNDNGELITIWREVKKGD